ncbi:MAG: RDD family protein [Bdellovibrionales bacterium]|nr:RDD family protein [Bdellovibrionales bacterium]
MTYQPIRSQLDSSPIKTGLWRRFVALIIDVFLFSYVSLLLFVLVIKMEALQFLILYPLVPILYDWGFHYFSQATPGKMIMGIELVNSKDLKPNAFKLLLRSIVKYIYSFSRIIQVASIFLSFATYLLFIISCLFVGFSSNKKSIHCYMSQTHNISRKPCPFFQGFLIFVLTILFSIALYGTSFFILKDTLANTLQNIPSVLGTYIEKQTTKAIQKQVSSGEILPDAADRYKKLADDISSLMKSASKDRKMSQRQLGDEMKTIYSKFIVEEVDALLQSNKITLTQANEIKGRFSNPNSYEVEDVGDIVLELEKLQKNKALEYTPIQSIQFVDQVMYNDAFAKLDPKAFDVDQDLVQSFESLLVLPVRNGMNSISFGFYLPILPNLIEVPQSLHFRTDPIFNVHKQQIKYQMTTPVFELKDQKYLFASSTLTYDGVPIDEIRVNFAFKLPTNVRKIGILSTEIKEEYYENHQRISKVQFSDKILEFTFAGIQENFLGIVAYTEDEEIIPTITHKTKDISSSVTVHSYTFEEQPHRVDLMVAENFYEKFIPAVIKLDRTFIRARDYLITFNPQPKQYFKKSVLDTHEIESKKYKIKIDNKKLTINSLDFGTIKENDWIHVEGKKVYINGKVVN